VPGPIMMRGLDRSLGGLKKAAWRRNSGTHASGSADASVPASHGIKHNSHMGFGWRMSSSLLQVLQDVKLAVAGSAACWSSHILCTMQCLGLLDPGWRQQPLESLLALSWQEPAVQQALGAMFLSRFQDPFHADPQLAPSRGVAMCQYAQWVSPLNPQVDLYTRAAAPPHTRLCLPFARLKNLAQLRIGCAHLEVQQGRKRRPAVPRQDRLCQLCSAEGAPQERQGVG
jgi:hypothetical protein